MKLTTPTRGFLLAALIGAVAMGACSLNPQPIPPGEQSADAGNDFGGGTGALSGDASTGDGSVVTGNPGPGDAGDASDDGGDAATDNDAATDAGDD
jgi:hypothetical protein